MSEIDRTKISELSERILPRMEEAIKNPNTSIDVHCHIFNHDYIPDKYFGIRLPFLMNEGFLAVVQQILNKAIPVEDDSLEHLAYFVHYAKSHSMLEIAEELINLSGKETILCPLMMDLLPGIGGNIQKDFYHQMAEMKDIRDKYPDKILPFVAIDPNNNEAIDIFQKAFSKDFNFFGVKVYPSLGYMPSHPTLMKVFEVCEQKKIPVTTHLGGSSVHSTKHSFDLPYKHRRSSGELIESNIQKTFFFKNEYGKFFNKPQNWEPVLREFPKLKLNFGHFGGDEEWEKMIKRKRGTRVHRIVDLMERYENVYTDISYLIHLVDNKNLDFLKGFEDLFYNNRAVQEKTLYGTDFYMITSEGKFKDLRSNFMFRVKKDILQKISQVNPKKFLFD
jgi:uncharacterized protein